MTFHYGSRTDSYILEGDQSKSEDFNGATIVERWYNLSSIDVLADPKSASVAVIGNSITDGYGVHNGPGNKWTDYFSEKLLDDASTSHVSVLNLGIGATTVIGSGIGRFQQDILEQAGLRWIIVFYGVNDIGANQSAENIINAYKTMISQAHAQNIRIYGATITPFKGHSYYSDSHEAVRLAVNEWIRTPGNFDKCIDFDLAIRDPIDTSKMHPDYSNDWLHPSAAGYQFMGEYIDVNLFLGADTLYDQPDMSKIESHYFEPECGSVGSNWDIIDDASVSNGAYITVKAGTQSLTSAAVDSESIIDFPFTITNDSTYYLYARLNCPSADDDSYWMKIDDGTFVMYNNLGTSGWQWLQLESFDLDAGDHTLSITYREDGAKLDKLCISNYFEAPIGMGQEAENLCDLTGTENISDIPDRYGLEQNFPNPFNPTTTINYYLAKKSQVKLRVFDILGKVVATLFEGTKSNGSYEINFDGNHLSSGVYYYRLEADQYVETRKFVLLK
jgi:lysophospholipase L1-like esterase